MHIPSLLKERVGKEGNREGREGKREGSERGKGMEGKEGQGREGKGEEKDVKQYVFYRVMAITGIQSVV